MGDETWEQKVRERAHAIWEREGRPDGAAERHWAMAETELRAEGVERLEAPSYSIDQRASPAQAEESGTDSKREAAR